MTSAGLRTDLAQPAMSVVRCKRDLAPEIAVIGAFVRPIFESGAKPMHSRSATLAAQLVKQGHVGRIGVSGRTDENEVPR